MGRGAAVFFEDPRDALDGLKVLHREGVEGLDLYSPYYLEEADEYLLVRPRRVSLSVFCGGALGALAAYGLQYLTAVHIYPFDVAGTPHHSWPAFLPFTFEFAVLLGSFTAFFSVLIFNGLPRYHHPVFDIEEFDRVTSDRFVIVVWGADPESLPELEKGVVREF